MIRRYQQLRYRLFRWRALRENRKRTRAFWRHHGYKTPPPPPAHLWADKEQDQ